MLIGNNGAGKSTFIKCILAITPYNGVITKNVTKIGYVPEKMFLPQHLSVTDFLKQVAYVKGIKNGVNNLLISSFEKWGILDKKDSPIKTLSKGMMQKVSIIQSLLDNNDLLIFDEVLNGLDRENQSLFFETIKELKDEGKTFIVSSHYPKEYMKVVDKILEVGNGNIIEYDKTMFKID